MPNYCVHLKFVSTIKQSICRNSSNLYYCVTSHRVVSNCFVSQNICLSQGARMLIRFCSQSGQRHGTTFEGTFEVSTIKNETFDKWDVMKFNGKRYAHRQIVG